MLDYCLEFKFFKSLLRELEGYSYFFGFEMYFLIIN